MLNFRSHLLRFFLAVLLLFCLNFAQAYDFYTAQHWYSHHPRNIWRHMRGQFQLLTPENKMHAQQQLKNYLKHPRNIQIILKQSAPYIAYILQETNKRHMPAEVALLPMVESNYNPFLFSKTGATGLWQLMPGTASGLGLEFSWWYDDRRDIMISTDASLRYLGYLYRFFNQWPLAIAAYNSGEGTISHAVKHSKSQSYWSLKLPKETQVYLPKLIALAMIIDDPKRYGITLPNVSTEVYFEAIKPHMSLDIDTIARWAKITPQEVRILNPGFRRNIAPSHISKSILLPKKSIEIFKNTQFIATATPSPLWTHHIVIPGESLGLIANHYHTSVKAILESNQLKSEIIHPGQSLMIPKNKSHLSHPPGISLKKVAEDHLPGPKHTVYIVKKNDSLHQIAQRFHVTVSALMYWNRLKTKKIHPGQKLSIFQHHHKNRRQTHKSKK